MSPPVLQIVSLDNGNMLIQTGIYARVRLDDGADADTCEMLKAYDNLKATIKGAIAVADVGNDEAELKQCQKKFDKRTKEAHALLLPQQPPPPPPAATAAATRRRRHRPAAPRAAHLPITTLSCCVFAFAVNGGRSKEAKRLMTNGAVVTTLTKAGSYVYNFTQEEVDKYELLHTARDRAAAQDGNICRTSFQEGEPEAMGYRCK